MHGADSSPDFIRACVCECSFLLPVHLSTWSGIAWWIVGVLTLRLVRQLGLLFCSICCHSHSQLHTLPKIHIQYILHDILFVILQGISFINQLGWPIGQHLNTHSVFLRVWPGAVSTCHTWHDIVRDDMYTCKCFSESEGTRFGGPGQKALPSMNEFTLLWNFCLIPLSMTSCSFDVPSKNL